MKLNFHGLNLTDLLSKAHAAIRERLAAMEPKERGEVAKCGKFQETHFYSWLRGADYALGPEKIDAVLEVANLRIYTGPRGHLSCDSKKTSVVSDWSKVDFSKRSAVLAKQLGVSLGAVSTARRRYAPETVDRTRRPKTSTVSFRYREPSLLDKLVKAELKKTGKKRLEP